MATLHLVLPPQLLSGHGPPPLVRFPARSRPLLHLLPRATAAATGASAAVSAPSDTGLQNFRRWLSSHGADTGAAAPSVVPEGVGLVATRSLNRGEVVAEVPKKLWMDADAVASSDIARVCSSAGDLRPWVSVSLLILREAACGADSLWAPYLAILPRQTDSTIFCAGQKKSSWSRILCLLHDKPAPAAHSSVQLQKMASVLQCAAVWAAVEAPAALATVSGEEDVDLLAILPPLAVIAFFYLFIAPPIIMNWMRLRWFKRGSVEMYLQFMFTYLFFPGLMLWAPFVNFRKFPRDPTMKYPWSKPKEGTPLFKDRYPQIDSFREKYYK